MKARVLSSLHRATRTLWDYLVGLVEISSRCELGLLAAGIAFFGFLAVFPAAATAIAIWGLVSDPALIRDQLGVLEEFLPPDALHLIEDQLQTLVAANSSTLGWTTVLSTGLALWSARAGVGALVQGLNAVHGTPQRATVGHNLQAIVMTLFVIAIALIAVVAGLIVPVLLAVLPLGPSSAMALELANGTVGLVVVVFGTGLAYRYGPNHRYARPPLFTLGLGLAVLLWVVASRGLMLYLQNFDSYNQVYGSIGAVVALLMWFYISAYAVLLGAALDALRADRG